MPHPIVPSPTPSFSPQSFWAFLAPPLCHHVIIITSLKFKTTLIVSTAKQQTQLRYLNTSHKDPAPCHSWGPPPCPPPPERGKKLQRFARQASRNCRVVSKALSQNKQLHRLGASLLDQLHDFPINNKINVKLGKEDVNGKFIKSHKNVII